MELNKEIDAQKTTQEEMKMPLKKPNSSTRISKEILTNGMNCAEDRP